MLSGFIALLALFGLSGCATSDNDKGYYQITKTSTIKSYQDTVNHEQNYVYRSDMRVYFMPEAQADSEAVQ